MNDVVALITGANKTLQNTNKVGNGLKSIGINLAGVKANAKDGSVELNKTALALKEIAGIDVYSNKSKGEIKDMMTLLDEVKGKWTSLSDEQRKGLSEAIAGKEQAAVFQSLMSNFDTVKQVQRELNDGWHFGSALAENTQYVDSLHGKLNKLKETWVGIFQTIFDSNAAKGFVDVLISISEAIASVVSALDKMGLLGVTSFAAVGLGIKKLIGHTKDSKSEILDLVTSVVDLVSELKGIDTIGESIETIGKTSTVSTVASGGLLKTLLKFGAAGLAIGAVGLVVKGLSDKLEEARTKYQRLGEEAKETISELEGQVNTNNEKISSLKKIQQEYDNLNSKVNRTSSEEERLKKLTEDIAGIMPELVRGYDSEGNPIIAMSGSAKDLIANLERANELKNKLIAAEQRDVAISSLGKSNSVAEGEYVKTIEAEREYNKQMVGIAHDRNTILEKLSKETDVTKRREYIDQLREINNQAISTENDYNIAMERSKEVLEANSAEVASYLTTYLQGKEEFTNSSKEVKEGMLELVSSLDFSQVKPEKLAEVEQGLRKLTDLANSKDVNLDNLIGGLQTSNKELAEGKISVEQYNWQIEQMAEMYSRLLGIDKDTLIGMFDGISVGAGNATEGLTQMQHELANSVEELMQTKNVDLKFEGVVDLLNKNDLPDEVRDLVKSIIGDGLVSDSELELLYKCIFEPQDEGVQQKIQEYQDSQLQIDVVIPETGQVEAFAQQIDSLPLNPTVKIELIKAYAEGDIEYLKQNLAGLPEEEKTRIIAEVSEAIANAEQVKRDIEAIPNESEKKVKVQTETSNAEQKVGFVQNLINNIFQKNKTKIDADSSDAEKEAGKAKKAINDIKQTKVPKIDADTASADRKLKTTKRHLSDIKSKSVSVTVTTNYQTKGTPSSYSSTLGGGMRSLGEEPAKESQASISEPISNSIAQPKTGEGDTATSTPVVASNPQTRATVKTPISTSSSSVLGSLKYSIELFQELYNRIGMVNNQLGLLEEKYKNAVGNERITFLKKQNELLKEQAQLQNELKNKLAEQQAILKKELSSKGFVFTSDNNLKNYEEKLLQMEREAERLEKAAESASKKVSDYSGKDENTREKLEKDSNKAKEKADKYNESLSTIKKQLSEYINITNQDLPDATKEWESLNNEIKKNNDELEKLNRRQKTFKYENKLTELERQYGTISDQLSKINQLMENAYGQDKLRLIQDQISLLEKQKDLQKQIIDQNNAILSVYKKDLQSYGFIFDNSSNITNIDEILNKFESSEDLEKINNLLKEFFNIQDNISDAKKDWQGLENEIKDAYKEQLKITKEIEEKITEVYKKQVEERKKLIDEELDKRLDALEKEKKAYNDARKEADYNKDYNKQVETIADLERQIDILSRDNSLSGQKKLQELMKQLASEQEKLQDMVQDKLDEQVNNMFDKEQNRLEQEADKAKDNLDEMYSDEKLQQIVKDTLASGVFVGVNGEIQDLQSTLIDFENKFGDGMSAMGDIIKNELVANLNVAKNTISDMSRILNELDLKKFSSELAISGGIGRSVSPMLQSSRQTTQPVINFNSELIRVEGNITEDVLPQVEEMLNTAKRDIVREIVNNM